ncbi:hypothetical protein NL676_019314 [Syzygium grande]|nr:hypothetical protein NL676_019314 [Syzygium grande]
MLLEIGHRRWRSMHSDASSLFATMSGIPPNRYAPMRDASKEPEVQLPSEVAFLPHFISSISNAGAVASSDGFALALIGGSARLSFICLLISSRVVRTSRSAEHQSKSNTTSSSTNDTWRDGRELTKKHSPPYTVNEFEGHTAEPTKPTAPPRPFPRLTNQPEERYYSANALASFPFYTNAILVIAVISATPRGPFSPIGGEFGIVTVEAQSAERSTFSGKPPRFADSSDSRRVRDCSPVCAWISCAESVDSRRIDRGGWCVVLRRFPAPVDPKS